MVTVVKLLLTAVLVALFIALGENAFTYFVFGGLKGGIASTLIAGVAHLVGLGILVYLIIKTWKFKT